MQPRDLTEMFEKVSGSHAHKDAYAKAEEAKARAEEQVAHIFSKKKAVTQGA